MSDKPDFNALANAPMTTPTVARFRLQSRVGRCPWCDETKELDGWAENEAHEVYPICAECEADGEVA